MHVRTIPTNPTNRNPISSSSSSSSSSITLSSSNIIYSIYHSNVRLRLRLQVPIPEQSELFAARLDRSNRNGSSSQFDSMDGNIYGTGAVGFVDSSYHGDDGNNNRNLKNTRKSSTTTHTRNRNNNNNNRNAVGAAGGRSRTLIYEYDMT